MTTQSIDKSIRAWLQNDLPGPFRGENWADVFSLALAAFKRDTGVDCPIGEFETTLRRMGHILQSRGHGDGAHVILQLPERPGTVASPFAGAPSRVRDRSTGIKS